MGPKSRSATNWMQYYWENYFLFPYLFSNLWNDYFIILVLQNKWIKEQMNEISQHMQSCFNSQNNRISTKWHLIANISSYHKGQIVQLPPSPKWDLSSLFHSTSKWLFQAMHRTYRKLTHHLLREAFPSVNIYTTE